MAPAPRRRSSAAGCCSASTNSPSVNSISASRHVEHLGRRDRRACADHRRPTPRTISVPPSRIERSECVPLPEAIIAVSPPMKLISSGVHAEQVRHHLREAGLVALAGRLRADRRARPCRRRHRHLDALVRDADRRLDVVGDADAAQPAALLRLARRAGKALPVGHVQHALHVAGEIAAVVEQPAGGAIGQLLVRGSGCCGAARTRSMPSRAAARSISRSSTSVASGRPAPRNGAVGTVLVITARQRMCISGMS